MKRKMMVGLVFGVWCLVLAGGALAQKGTIDDVLKEVQQLEIGQAKLEERISSIDWKVNFMMLAIFAVFGSIIYLAKEVRVPKEERVAKLEEAVNRLREFLSQVADKLHLPNPKSVLLFLLAFSLLISIAHAGVPRAINYQGKTTAGLAAEPTVAFKIFDSQSGGAQLWPESGSYTAGVDYDSTTGIFSTTIGSAATPLTDAIMNASEAWLEAEVGGSTLPRQRLLAAPYALKADVAETATSARTAQSLVSYNSTNVISLGITAAQNIVGLKCSLNLMEPPGSPITSGAGLYGIFGNRTYNLASDLGNLKTAILGTTDNPNAYAGYFLGGRGVKIVGTLEVTTLEVCPENLLLSVGVGSSYASKKPLLAFLDSIFATDTDIANIPRFSGGRITGPLEIGSLTIEANGSLNAGYQSIRGYMLDTSGQAYPTLGDVYNLGDSYLTIKPNPNYSAAVFQERNRMLVTFEVGSNLPHPGVSNLIIEPSGNLKTLGNVGIGTTEAESRRLKVAGTIEVTDGTANNSLILKAGKWESWPTTTNNGYIINDQTDYKKLMIVGNSTGGGTRQVGIWDDLTVSGNVYIPSSSGGKFTGDGSGLTNLNLATGITSLTLDSLIFRRGDNSKIQKIGSISFDWTDGDYDTPTYHGIESKGEGGTLGDSLRINSFNNIINTIDSNTNNPNSSFIIQKESPGDGTNLFTVDESGNATLVGNLSVSDYIRADDGLIVPMEDASAGSDVTIEKPAGTVTNSSTGWVKVRNTTYYKQNSSIILTTNQSNYGYSGVRHTDPKYFEVYVPAGCKVGFFIINR